MEIALIDLLDHEAEALSPEDQDAMDVVGELLGEEV